MKVIITIVIYLVGIQWAFSQVITPPPPPPPPSIPLEEKVCFPICEEMPRFPGCEDLPDRQEKQDCANKKMLEFIYENIKFTDSNCLGGCYMVVVTFIVEKDGNLSNFQLKRGIDTKLGEEVLRVAKTLPTFIPGKQVGRLVRTQFNLPIRVRLE